jgi:acyl carrier protein
MNTIEFASELEKELGLAPGSIHADTRFRDLRQWDSLAEIALLALVEEKLSLQLSPFQLQQKNTVQELVDLTS